VYDRRIDLPIDRTIAPVIGLADLIELKRAAGRVRDLEDVGALLALPEGGTDDRQDSRPGCIRLGP
jgi:hypothetical protein